MPASTTKFSETKTVGGSIQLAPSYVKHREGVAALDAAAPTEKKQGINAARYKKAHVQVVPSGGANPTVEVLFWSDVAGKFIKGHTALTRAGIGADTPFEFTFDVEGRIFFVMVTALAAGAVTVAVAGSDKESVAD